MSDVTNSIADPAEDGLVLLKPDGVQRGLADTLAERAAARGLRLQRRHERVLTLADVASVWPQIDPVQRPVTTILLHAYLVGRKSIVHRYTGRNAARVAHAVKTDLRSGFGDYIYANVAHAPDDHLETAAQLQILETPSGSDRSLDEVLPDRWHRWDRAEIMAAAVPLFRRAVERATQSPTLWMPGVDRCAQWSVVTVVGSPWVTAFDRIVALLADAAETRNLRWAITGALASLYDRSGASFAVGDGERAERIAGALSAEGLTSLAVAPTESISAALTGSGGRP